ncbi:MAG: hypothetical protein A2031_07060 [Deltaproteobacteria bacterium RBG_19FT_COMBO_43_11]|nr:MAG: hypothetical protein A2031_07060 [Deltaproteobacteria bacterium RBG_19FT_COMBO_43_11]
MFRCKARKKPNREAYYGYTLSGVVCRATKQMSVFQQPLYTHNFRIYEAGQNILNNSPSIFYAILIFYVRSFNKTLNWNKN